MDFDCSSLLRWFSDLLNQFDSLVVAVQCVYLNASMGWAIWLARNNWVFNGVRPSIFKVAEASLRSFFECHSVKSFSLDLPLYPPSAAFVTSSPSNWMALLRSIVMLLFSKSGVAIACVIRDASGRLIDFFGKQVCASSMVVAEALASVQRG